VTVGRAAGLACWLLALGLFAAAATTAAEPPRRIVSLAPSLTEVLFAVGAGDQVVGVTEFCNYPPEVLDRPRIGGVSPNTISLERIVALAPDLVLSGGDGQEQLALALIRLGIPTRTLAARTLPDVLELIEETGALTGHTARGRSLRAELAERIERVRRQVAARPGPRPRVFYQVWDQPLITTGRSFLSELIELAGGVNVFGDLPQAFPQVSEEAVLARDPEVILAPDRHREQIGLDALRRRPGWDRLTAVRTGRIYLLPGDPVSRPGPRLVDVLETLAGLLAPEPPAPTAEPP
jgi:iron complex transport system substrate-binding protein